MCGVYVYVFYTWIYVYTHIHRDTKEREWETWFSQKDELFFRIKLLIKIDEISVLHCTEI